MRLTWRSIGLTVLVVSLAFGAMGCAKKAANTGSSPGGGGGGSFSVRTPTVEPTELTSSLAGQAGGQTTGTAKFIAGNPGTRVTVEMKGLPPGAHTAYIYHVNCEGQGEKHGPLTQLDAGADGAGTSSTQFVSFTLGHFLEGDHFVAVHAATGDNPGAVISCGKIENASAATGAATATATTTP